MIYDLTESLIRIGHTTSAACQIAGYPRASFYRHHRTAPVPPRPVIHQRDRHQPAALSDTERAQILQILSSQDYADLSIAQVFYRCLDACCYIASLSSWYRVARDHAMVGDRRRQARAKPKKIPELSASGTNQVWSWDITKLKGPCRGQYWHLYVIIDIYSRYVTGWALHDYEDGRLAEELITRATTNNGAAPTYLHSDNGAAMTSRPVSGLAELLGVELSFSRPKVSNDNPYSEALFKTAKYDLRFPEDFASFTDALNYCEMFFSSYNSDHRHSGIGYHTPATVHHDHTNTVDAARQEVLDTAWRAHPERFTRRPQPPTLPDTAHINNKPTKTTHHLSHTG